MVPLQYLSVHHPFPSRSRPFPFSFNPVLFPSRARPVLVPVPFSTAPSRPVPVQSRLVPFPSRSAPVPFTSRSHPVLVRSRPRTVSVPFPSRLALVPFASPSRPVSFQFPRLSSFVQLMTRFYMFRFVSVCFHLSRPILLSISVQFGLLFFLILPVPVLSLFLSFPFRSMLTVPGSLPILHSIALLC